MPKKSFKVNTKDLISALKNKQQEARRAFQTTHQDAQSWFDKHKFDLGNIRDHSKNLLTSGAVIGALLITPPSALDDPNSISTVKQRLYGLNLYTNSQLGRQIIGFAKPATNNLIGHLSLEEEHKLEELIKNTYGIKVSNTLEGQKLNHSVGMIGYEQHLKRFPGDDINLHDEELIAGIAPGLGAWGYFSHSRESFDQEDYLREKYYFAVQTLYLPNWNTDHRKLAPWYKYRKMLAINPENGEMVVGVIADAGPADWTGKHFGGSPEVMKTLDLHLKSRKGKIILLFVDDPQNEIPLGKVTGPISSNIKTT